MTYRHRFWALQQFEFCCPLFTCLFQNSFLCSGLVCRPALQFLVSTTPPHSRTLPSVVVDCLRRKVAWTLLLVEDTWQDEKTKIGDTEGGGRAHSSNGLYISGTWRQRGKRERHGWRKETGWILCNNLKRVLSLWGGQLDPNLCKENKTVWARIS